MARVHFVRPSGELSQSFRELFLLIKELFQSLNKLFQSFKELFQSLNKLFQSFKELFQSLNKLFQSFKELFQSLNKLFRSFKELFLRIRGCFYPKKALRPDPRFNRRWLRIGHGHKGHLPGFPGLPLNLNRESGVLQWK